MPPALAGRRPASTKLLSTLSTLTAAGPFANLPFVKGMYLSVFVLIGGILARAADQLPDFKLSDVNPNSNRRAGWVSPRDYLLQVSGYYFGEAH